MAAAADEPRRSGRATKGQHTKNADEDASPEAPKTKGKGKASKKSKAEAEQAAEDDEEGDDSISCLCGVTDDEEDGRNFLCCDKCETWQHNDCMGLPAKYNPEKYFCWRCRPEDHPDIVEALAQGEKPDDVAIRMRTRKPVKKGRQSLKGTATKTESAASATPVPEQNKRKHTGDENGDLVSSSPIASGSEPIVLTNPKPSKRGKSSTPAMPPTPAPETGGSMRGRGRRGAKSQTADAAESTNAQESKLAQTIADLAPETRQRIATALRDKFSALIKTLVSKGSFKLPKDHTPEALAEKQAIAVEFYMFSNHCSKNPTDFSGPYQNQFRTIISNIAQNAALLQSLLDGQLSPDALSTMSSADMATEEQKKLDEKMKKEGEKQAMLIQEEGPRIRRTHKGEELVEEIGGVSSESITSAAPPRRQLGDPDNEDMTLADVKPSRPAPIVTGQDSVQDGHRRSSSNFNIQSVWSKVQSPTTEARGTSRSVSASVPQRPQQADPEIDELLNRDGEDEAPYSPVDAGHDPYLVWRGNVDMPVNSNSIFQFPVNAYHMAGTDLGGKEQQANIFPKDLILAGRIAADTADNYLTSLSAAHHTDVSVFELIAYGHDAGVRDQFNKLFSYLKDRKRFGVIEEGTHRGHVRDVYLIPLNAGNSDTPQFLQRLAHNILEDPRTKPTLLVVFVLRYKDTAAASTATPEQPALFSPTGPAPGRAPSMSMPAMSPTTATEERGPTPQFPQTGHASPSGNQYSFPSNPYAPSPAAATSSVQAQNRSLAFGILGPMVNAPVAQSILETATTVLSAAHLESLRQIFQNHPSAQTDMQEVQRALGRQNAGPK